jgi:hypothetical protein
LRGELDWVVMKCLEKDRNRRYDTASALARDLERFLAGEPVEACPPSAAYRLRKFVGKYRRPLATAAAFLGLLLAGGAVTVWQAIQLARTEYANVAAQARRSRELHEALEQTLVLRAQARSAKEGARDPWAESLALARRMETLLEGGPVEPDLAERVRAFVSELEQEARDQRMVATLNDLRLRQVRVTKQAFFVDPSRYPDAFRGYGLDVEALPVAETAERVRGSAIREELIAALDLWVRITPFEDPGLARLRAVVDAADDSAWRRTLRQASRSRDPAYLRPLAQDPQTRRQPLADQIFLGRLLNMAGLRDEAAALLRPAQMRHPADFWVNTELSLALLNSRPPRPRRRSVIAGRRWLSDPTFPGCTSTWVLPCST